MPAQLRMQAFEIGAGLADHGVPLDLVETVIGGDPLDQQRDLGIEDDAFEILRRQAHRVCARRLRLADHRLERAGVADEKGSDEPTPALQSLMRTPYAVFYLIKTK